MKSMKDNPKAEYLELSINNKILLNDSYYLLETEKTDVIPLPGQFYLLKPVEGFPSLLHIPVSIYDIDGSKLRFMIKIVGKGTESLSRLKVKERIKALGPLGKGFTFPVNTNTLLISGGIGYAPLYLLKKQLLLNSSRVNWLHGGRSSEDVFPADVIYTEDGSRGERGLVTKDLKKLLADSDSLYDSIYCCGPKRMMKEVYNIAHSKKIPLQVSLEEYMACGMGICLGCAVKVTNNGEEEYQTVCHDGPVFAGEKVVWDE